MAKLRDYSSAIAGLDEMTLEQLHDIYSQMLATAHDISYAVPDEQLVETDDESVLRKIIPPLHEGLVKFNAGLDTPRVAGSAGKKSVAKKKAAAKPKDKESKTASSPTAPVQSKETTMAATAKKAAPAAKKAAKAVKKGSAKKAKANARTPAAPRNKWSEKAKIKVLADENPCRKGTGRHERVANLFKYDGKLVSDFLAKGGKTGTLAYSAEQGWVKVVG